MDPATLVRPKPLTSNNSDGHKVIHTAIDEDIVKVEGETDITGQVQKSLTQTELAEASMSASFHFSCPRPSLERMHQLFAQLRRSQLMSSVDGIGVPIAVSPSVLTDMQGSDRAANQISQLSNQKSSSGTISPQKQKPKGKKAVQRQQAAEELREQAQKQLLEVLRSPAIGGEEAEGVPGVGSKPLKWPISNSASDGASSFPLAGIAATSNITSYSATTNTRVAQKESDGVAVSIPTTSSLASTVSRISLGHYLTTDTIATAFAQYEMLYGKQTIGDPKASATLFFRLLEQDLASLQEVKGDQRADDLMKSSSLSTGTQQASSNLKPLVVADVIKRIVISGDSDDTTKIIKVLHIRNIEPHETHATASSHLVLRPIAQPLSDTCAVADQQRLLEEARAEQEMVPMQWTPAASRSRSIGFSEGFKFGDSASHSVPDKALGEGSTETFRKLSGAPLQLCAEEAELTSELPTLAGVLKTDEDPQAPPVSSAPAPVLDAPTPLRSRDGTIPPTFAMLGECVLVVAEILRLEGQSKSTDKVEGQLPNTFAGLSAPTEQHKVMYRSIQCLTATDMTDLSLHLGAWPKVVATNVGSPKVLETLAPLSKKSVSVVTQASNTGTTTGEKGTAMAVDLLYCAQAVAPQLSTADGRSVASGSQVAEPYTQNEKRQSQHSSSCGRRPSGSSPQENASSMTDPFSAAIIPSTLRPAAVSVDLAELYRYEMRLIAESAAEEEMALIERARMKLYVQGKKLSAAATARLEALTVAKDLKYIADVNELFSNELGENLGADWTMKRKRRGRHGQGIQGDGANDSGGSGSEEELADRYKMSVSGASTSHKESTNNNNVAYQRIPLYGRHLNSMLLKGGTDNTEINDAIPHWSMRALLKRDDNALAKNNLPSPSAVSQVANNSFKARHEAFLKQKASESVGTTSPRKTGKVQPSHGSSEVSTLKSILSFQEQAALLIQQRVLGDVSNSFSLAPTTSQYVQSPSITHQQTNQQSVVYLDLKLVAADGRCRSGRVDVFIQ